MTKRAEHALSSTTVNKCPEAYHKVYLQDLAMANLYWQPQGSQRNLSNKILSSFQKQLITLYMHKFPLKMHSTLFNSWFNFKLIWGINIWRFWRFRVASIIFSKGNEYLADITFFQYGTPIALNSWFHIRCLQTANFSWMQTQNYSLDLSLCAKSCPPTWTQLNIIRTLILSPFCPF